MSFDPEKNKIINLGTITAKPETRADQVGFSKGKDRDQEDWFKFTLKNDSNFNLSLDQLQQNADITLYEGDRASIIETSRNQNQQPERINTFLDAGTYFLKVVPKGSDRTDYLLSLNALSGDDPDGNRERATELTLSQEPEKVPGKVGFVVDGTRDQNDYYQFTLKKPRDVNINLDDLNQNANLALLDSTGSLLFTSTNSGQQLDNINVILEPETYYIKVSPFVDDRTQYLLSATAKPFGERDDNLPGKDLGTINKRGQLISDGRIGFGSGNDIDGDDYYKFSIEKESKLNLTLEPKSSNADLELYGIDADNDIVPIFSSNNKGTKIDELSPILDPGDYFARVKKAGTNRTKYVLNLSANPDITDADGDIPGTPLAEFAIDPTKPRDKEDPTTKKSFGKKGKIGFGSEDNRDLNDFYNFTLLEKGDVNIKLDELTANADLKLLDSEGRERGSSSKRGNNAEEIQEILGPGTYYVGVFPNNNKARTGYQILLAANPAEDDYPSPGKAKQLDILDRQDRVIERNQIGFKEGSIDDGNDFYKFSIGEASGFNLKLDKLSANANVFLLDSDLNEKAKSVKAGTTTDTITEELEPGDYFVRVVPPGRGGTKYRLDMEAKAIGELDGDRTPQAAQVIGQLDLLPEAFRKKDSIGFTQLGIKDEKDFYRFEVAQKSDFSLKLNKLKGLVTAKLFSGDGDGNLNGEAILDESTREPLSASETLNPGTYYLQIEGNKTNYALTLNARPFQPLLLFEDTAITEGNLNDLGEAVIQTVQYPVSLSEATTQTVTVDYAVVDRNATVGEDYNVNPAGGTLSFAPGETSKTIPVQIFGDVKPEKEERLSIELSDPVGAKFEGKSQRATMAIANDDFPQISITDTSIEEINSGTRSAVFAVSLDRPSDEMVSVGYFTENGTASFRSDYTPSRGRLTFRKGETTKEIKIPIKGDRRVEADETFLLNLQNPKKATIAIAQATGTILDNDLPKLSVEDVSLPEGNLDPITGQPLVTNFEFTVTLSDVTSKTVSVNYAIEDDSATLAEDYNAASGTVTFAPGEVAKTIIVPVLGDMSPEVDEAFLLKLSDPVHSKFKDSKNKQATGTILNDELPRLSIADLIINEGNSGTKTVRFPITMEPASDVKVTVKYATAGDSAEVREDYLRTTGTLTIRPGETIGEIEVPILGNQRIEPDETFFINLKSAENATIADNQATGTIVDNDFPKLSVGDVKVVEGASGVAIANFPVTLNRPGVKTLTVDYATTDEGNATAGIDYTATSDRLSFAPGETEKTVAVEVFGDGDIENDERFFLDVSNIVNGQFAEKSGDRSGRATITNDDVPTIAIADAVNIEDGRQQKFVIFDVSLDRSSKGDVTVQFSTENGSAFAREDYNATSNTLTIPKRETTATIKIPIVSDQKSEPDETFSVKLANPKNAVFTGGKTELQATGIILDNDDPLTGDRKFARGTREADTFALGTAEGALYAEKGNSDYVVIANFEPGQDTIELHGSATDYQLAPIRVGLIAGTAIYQKENGQELIGIVKDSASLSLDSGFSFV